MDDEAKDAIDYLEARALSSISQGMAWDLEMCTKTAAVIERQAAENAALKAENIGLKSELDKVCLQQSLVRCKGCGDYIFHTDVTDEEKGCCWGCQIDGIGETSEEYRLNRDAGPIVAQEPVRGEG